MYMRQAGRVIRGIQKIAFFLMFIKYLRSPERHVTDFNDTFEGQNKRPLTEKISIEILYRKIRTYRNSQSSFFYVKTFK